MNVQSKVNSLFSQSRGTMSFKSCTTIETAKAFTNSDLDQAKETLNFWHNRSLAKILVNEYFDLFLIAAKQLTYFIEGERLDSVSLPLQTVAE